MGKKTKIEQRKELIKDKFILSSEKLFQSKGIHLTTMEDIAEDALYSKAALYQYFSNKDEIIIEICIKGLRIMLDMFEQGTSKYNNSMEKVFELGNQHFRFMTEFNFYHIMLSVNLQSVNFAEPKLQEKLIELQTVDAKIEKLMITIIDEGQKNNELRKTTDAETTAMLLKGMSSGIYTTIMRLCGNDKKMFENQGYSFYKEFQKFIQRSLEND